MNISSHNRSLGAIKLCLMCLLLTLATPPAEAQTAGKISIGGKVYGGGKNGAILTGNDNSDPANVVTDTDSPDFGKILPKDVTLAVTNFTADAAQASQVTINATNDADILITAVFGGGEKGRAYGKTNVTVNGGTIGVTNTTILAAMPAENLSVNGNAFGAGDGAGADVFGGTHVLITAGTINGSVYGGGNQADLVGSTELTLQGGKYVGAVFGGAKQADIFGRTFVNVDGLHAKNDLHIIDVYGGNDIAGNINPSDNWSWTQESALSANTPFALASTSHLTRQPGSVVNGTWNAFVLATDPARSSTPEVQTRKVLIDNIYGGGNGDYGETNAEGVYTTGAYAGQNLKKPVIDRTYLQIEGGMYGSLYGGGNAATVAVSTDICLLNSTDVSGYLGNLANLKATSDNLDNLGNLGNLGDITKKIGYTADLDTKNLLEILDESASRYSADYQFNRVFGGNNKEPMAIRPNWYLEEASVNNLYSGGNAGPMTYFNNPGVGQQTTGGIILAIESSKMTINNVYGGCRMADVVPGGTYDPSKSIGAETFLGQPFQIGYAARVLVKGGNINNVYGGNDVSGNVYYGAQVEILSSINGNVYGAGNGSYAYTDNVNLKGDKEYGDYYYDGGTGGLASAQALSIHRPNAAQSYVHVAGTSTYPTYIGGAIYCGGNSATLRALGNDAAALKNAKSELHIGSYVIADNVFLGSNGENMVKSALPTDLLQIYKNGPDGYDKATKGAYSSMNLTNSAQFEEYMRGVEVAIKPTVTFDDGYVSHSTKFGSLYCGGNVGSMSADGYFNVDFLQKLVIYNKLVGGCNNANVAKTDYNAYHMGGLTGAPDANNNKVLLTVAGLQLEPRVLTGNVEDDFNLDTWNKTPIAGVTPTKYMLQGGNIYGGCYSSGYINGGVNIDIQENTISPNVFPGSGVTYEEIRDDVLASTLTAYGGGYGKETEIWGNVTVSITGNGQIMKAYGGGEMGVVGKLQRNAETGEYATATVQEWYPAKTDITRCTETFEVSDYTSRPHTVAQFTDDGIYNATVNLNATLPAGTTNNVAKLYAGGFQGTVSGNTTANLNRGRAYDAFGGASNADILGHAETYIGKASAPTITHNVYGANDFGGLIVGEGIFYVDNNKDGDHEDTMEKILAQTYVEYASGKIGDGSRDSYGDPVNGNVFGGPCGAYDYADTRYTAALDQPGFCKPMLLRDLMTSEMLIPDPLGEREHVGYAANSFVNVTSQSTLATDEVTGSIFGAGQGMKGHINSADERGSYVRLMAATTGQRTVGPLSPRVYGAGYCSNTSRSLVDAHTGHFGTIFGAAHGISYEELTEMQLHSPAGVYETNYMGWRSAVRLYEMTNRNMDIYGGGANAGAQEAGVVLYGGQAHDVYGGQYDQGITYAASVDVPETSTTKVNAIFGGARGKNDSYPCDVYNTYVTWRSASARVNDAIYGGNNNARMTRNAYISINQPVKNSAETLTNVFGGGFGENTVTLYTEVGLHDGAQVANAYGGGNNGKVLDTPSFRYYLDDGELECPDGTIKPVGDGRKTYPSELSKTSMTAAGETPIYGYQKYLRDTEVIGFHEWIKRYNWKDCRTDGRGHPIGSYEANNHGHAHDLYFLSTQMDNVKNTHVIIEQGAVVAENVYGGGLGELATVSGETNVQLLGGIVRGDIYGGGKGGHVEEYPHLIFPTGGEPELVLSGTYVDLGGGSARNVYGGGLEGNVTGKTHVTLGSKDQGENNYFGTWDTGTNLAPTKNDVITTITRGGHPYYGDPIVERSLYGGGEKGAVYGTTYLTINQGHVGYKYDPDGTFTLNDDVELKAEYDKAVTDGNTGKQAEILAEVEKRNAAAIYVENLHLNSPSDNFLDQNGNAFGAGYGEGASVDVTYVNVYGGTIRNSLYGGGEIAAVGRGTMAVATGPNKQLGSITVAGRTHIYMYNGLVQGDVFGGGRGYSYDLTGNEIVGKTLYTDGYVFGTTEVEMRGGTVGTEATVAEGHGNVFGGGNIGYCFSDGVKRGVKGDGQHPGDGRYYTNEWVCSNCGHHEHSLNAPTVCDQCGYSPGATDSRFRTTFTQVNAGGTAEAPTVLSEDCRVIITPYAQVTAENTQSYVDTDGKTKYYAIEIDGIKYTKGEYVPTDELDKLLDKNTATAQWAKLSLDGVTVRNAVFAGGNVSSGSDKVYANAITVFGNATATVKDIFFRDLVTLGTEHTGGLYGDGNLTFVDGYRELNITNYGTDYYGQQDHISLDQYNEMNDRERAYFQLEYQTSTDHTYTYYTCTNTHTVGDVTYQKGQQITPAAYTTLVTNGEPTSNWASGSHAYSSGNRISESEWGFMTPDEKAKWTIYGFCSIYAGRLLNTIQRADFCGVFGSRMVLQGAQDRVPEVVDYTQYTINRVGELSLNKATVNGIEHGNYFGMYNVVNYLGALTSDVKFDDVRTTDNTNPGYGADGTTTYWQWKTAHEGDRKRNNGTCHNMVALASGVYLEVVKEPTSALSTTKDYGYITGIVQLDLINVMPGLGGGYVYAKNEHGTRSGNPGIHQNLSKYNQGAVNNSAYTYDESNKLHVETSGNFIHNLKQIVDDCYPAGGEYTDYNKAPAHYWYIRGEIYVYDQYISAFTGSSNAYTENINLPLTITAGANGRLDLLDIKPNYYAYYNKDGEKLGPNEHTVVNNITYALNDVITYWEYMQLTSDQQHQFVDKTYVCTMDYCEQDEFENGQPKYVIEKGAVLLPSEFNAIANETIYYDPEDITATNPLDPHMAQKSKFDIFHVSNAVEHDNGYVLTVDLSNPMPWDKWYSPEAGNQKIDLEDYNKPATEKSKYTPGPTYYPTTSGVYGQRQYAVDDIVTKTIVDTYTGISSGDKQALVDAGKAQAVVAPAYVAVTAAEYSYLGVPKNVQAGVGISKTEYDALPGDVQAKFARALTCTSTYEENPAEAKYIYYGELITETKYQALYDELIEAGMNATEAKAHLAQSFDNAYIVTTAGLYGGQKFVENQNYRAIDTWATLSKEDRQFFRFRFDALDALALGNYPGTGSEGGMTDYDDKYWDPAAGYPEHKVYGEKQPIDYTAVYTGTNAISENGVSLTPNQELTREQYEALPNEQRHYSHFAVTEADKDTEHYIVKETFINGGTTYSAGRLLTAELYESLNDDIKNNNIQTFTPGTAGDYYICRRNYTIADNATGYAVTDLRISGSGTIAKGGSVTNGVIINKNNYDNLCNYQINSAKGIRFTVHGNSPIETSTFYVNRESDIYDLSKERVITVVYQYKYEESDESGLNIEEITERHIVNIHIEFKSGVPTIGKLQEPAIVLPGQTVGLKLPNVTPGAYEILGGGWELFTNAADAEKHQNGQTYVNNATKMYWYENGYYVAYYAKTYLGKTYSNAVPFKVANYHDIAEVWADSNYMFIDHPDVDRNSKIYIDNSYVNETPTATESEIDMFYDLFQKSLVTNEKTIQIDVQDVELSGEDPLYWEVDSEGNKTGAKTTTPDANDVPVYLYYKVDGEGNPIKTETQTEPTAFPVTHKADKQVPTFNDHVRNLANLDFFLSDNVETIKEGGWQPIGTVAGDGECFMGTLHGMGYTISGLNNSLFENLCGHVYNLGVTGSFTKSGIADHVSTGTVPDSDDEKVYGYVNSSWIYTSADPFIVGGTPGQPYYPVVGEPNNPDPLADGGVLAGMHVHNCYYPEECGYFIDDHSPLGAMAFATSKTLREFNTGEVTYDLNGFYLNKRYSDVKVSLSDIGHTNVGGVEVATGDDAIYKFWKQDENGDLIKNPTAEVPVTPVVGYYKGGGSMHAYDGKNLGYVERFFADGDFVYRNGTIPTEENERYSSQDSRYLPIWPDDYYFFGQQLTYGYDETDRPYQPLPSNIRKTDPSLDGAGQDRRLVQTEANNIVYRTPAYYRSKDKGMIYFNPYAVFADRIKDGYYLGANVDDPANGVLDGRDVHPGLTAIDFTGFNDRAIMTAEHKFKNVDEYAFTLATRTFSESVLSEHPELKPLNDQVYFGPITDYTTLMDIKTFGITQNLLAYAPTTTFTPGTAHALEVLQGYFTEPAYADKYSNDKYRTVAALDESTISGIHGHLVQKENTTTDRHYYYAPNDHFLVDRQDFNAPIEYEFIPAKGKTTTFRMWYQRAPKYVDATKGWEGISLPFAAELVTTQDKGEITHFYNNDPAVYERGYNSGHEYWLREYKGTLKDDADNIVGLDFMSLTKYGSESKEVTNTFLWDYYYNADGKDANNDDYRYDGNHEDSNSEPSRLYYSDSRTYAGYPYQAAGRPYIAGFPGDRYYEFDLSGTFVPLYSGTTTPAQLDPQTISFVSNTGITIAVSDEECTNGVTTAAGYSFVPSYLNHVAPVSDAEQAYLLLNAEGSAYEKTFEDVALSAFRPYFKLEGSAALKAPASLGVGAPKSYTYNPEKDEQGMVVTGSLKVYTQPSMIVVESGYEQTTQVRIVSMTGVPVATFKIEPGAQVTTPIFVPGIYMVNTTKVLVGK